MNTASARPVGQHLAAMPASSRPNGVFAANDLIALGLLQQFVMANLSVPGDIALIGYDDIDFARSAAVPLSSIRQPSADIGVTAIDLLLAATEAPEAKPRHVVFRPELVARASTVT
jgi:LacI family transcriptional regulator